MLLLYIAYRYARLKAKNRHPYRKCLVMIRRGSLWLAFEKNLSQCLNRRIRPAIDFRGALRQNTLVRKLIAGNAVALLVIITFLAPLFHLHTDEHGQA